MQILGLLLSRSFDTTGAFETRVVVEAIDVKFGRGAVEGNAHIAPRHISGPIHGIEYSLDGCFGTRQGRSKAAFVAHGGTQTLFMQHLLQRMEHLGTHAQPFLKRRCPHGTNHKLLKSNGSIGVRASVDDIHHGDRHHIGIGPTDISIQGDTQLRGCRFGYGQRDAQDGVGTQFRLRGGAVEVDQLPVDTTLLEGIGPFECFCNHLVDVVYSLLYPFTTVTQFITVAQFEGLVCTGRSSRRNRGTASYTRIEHNIDFDCGVAPRVENLPSLNVCNFFHTNLI